MFTCLFGTYAFQHMPFGLCNAPGIVLGHVVSSKGLEVDKAKVEVIQDLALPKSIRELRSFLGHVGFYRRFIQDFAKVSKPLTSLLCKEKDFIIEESGKHAFMQLK